jgi:hypothetical protein
MGISPDELAAKQLEEAAKEMETTTEAVVETEESTETEKTEE